MKIIRSVTYRHLLLTAYVEIVGMSKKEALISANEVHKTLSQGLAEAIIISPRYLGQGTSGEHIFTVPAVIAKCPNVAKPFISRMVLAGRL